MRRFILSVAMIAGCVLGGSAQAFGPSCGCDLGCNECVVDSCCKAGCGGLFGGHRHGHGFGGMVGPGCGCDVAPAPACDVCAPAPACDACAPACGHKKHGCGLLARLHARCHAAPSCGCDVAPVCGCDIAPACAAPAPACDVCAPACDVCAPACGGHKHCCGLIARLKALCHSHHHGCCDAAPSCGCDIAAPTCGCDIAPAAPACCN